MKNIMICKATGLKLEPPENVTIHIVDEIPEFHSLDGLKKCEEFHQAEAEKFVEAMLESMPQGTTDRVMALLMKRQADRSCYRGTVDDPGGYSRDSDRKWPRIQPLYTESGGLIPRYDKATAAEILIEQRKIVDKMETREREIQYFLENARNSVRHYETYLQDEPKEGGES